MKAAISRIATFTAIIGILVLLGPQPAVRCEVGADLNPVNGNAAIATIYQIASIGDGPDPWSGIWLPLGASVPGRIVLNPQGDTSADGPPSVISDPVSGLILVAWAKNSPNGFDVVISRFTDGVWTGPQVVAGDALFSEKDPNLVLGPDGSVHLFYWIDGASPAVYYTHATGDLSTWSPPTVVSQLGEPACRPAGAFHNGVLHVAYEVHDFGFNSSPREVVLSRQDGAGFTPEVVAMTNNAGSVSPQVHSHSGHIWVDWVDAETSGAGELAWTRVNAQGQWEPIQYEPFADPLARDFLVRAAVKLKAIH